MRNACLALIASLCVLVLGACGGGGEDATPSPTPNFETAAQSLAPRVPLAIGDVPGGWTEAAADDQDLTANVDLPDECNIFDLNVAFPAAFVTASGARLRGPAGQQVTSYGAIYRTTEAAQAAVDGTRDILSRCADDYKSAVERVADDSLSSLGIHLGFLASIDVTLDEQPQATADGSAFYRLQAKISLPGDDLTFTLDARVVRTGRAVGAVTFYAQGEGDTPDETEVTAAVVANTAEVERALPR